MGRAVADGAGRMGIFRGNAMTHDVRTETLLAQRPLAVVRRQATIAQLSKVVPEACGLVWKALRAYGVTGAGRHIAVYLDANVDVLNVEVGVELAAPLGAPVGEVVASAVPAGTVATATHMGPYPTLSRTHQAIRDWCKAHRHDLAGPNWELYGHWLDEWNQDASKIRTDVFYLLK